MKTTPIPVKFDRQGHSCNFYGGFGPTVGNRACECRRLHMRAAPRCGRQCRLCSCNHELAIVDAWTCVLLPGVGGSVGYAVVIMSLRRWTLAHACCSQVWAAVPVMHDLIVTRLSHLFHVWRLVSKKNFLYTHINKVNYTMGTSMNARRSYLIRITSTVTSKHLHVYTCQITHLWWCLPCCTALDVVFS